MRCTTRVNCKHRLNIGLSTNSVTRWVGGVTGNNDVINVNLIPHIQPHDSARPRETDGYEIGWILVLLAMCSTRQYILPSSLLPEKVLLNLSNT